jgi:hypothetical protein
VLRLSEQVRSTHNPDGAIVLDIRRGQMFRLNPVGYRILALLEAGHEEQRIADEISREFRITHDIVRNDVREFLAILEKHRLLEERNSNGQA